MEKNLDENKKMNFDQAAQKVKTLSKEPDNKTKLLLYGLYKQSTVGDINISEPSIWYAVARAKWHAWKEQEGKSQDQSKREYVSLAEQLIKEE